MPRRWRRCDPPAFCKRRQRRGGGRGRARGRASSRAILGAALDVTAVEPLPEGHPFYALKNCLMSFHCADLTEDYFELSAEVFARHARAYVDGATGTEGAWNVVDKRAGY